MAACIDCMLYPMCYVVREVGARDGYAEDCQHFKNKNEYAKTKYGEWLIDDDGKWLKSCYTPYCNHCGYRVHIGSIKSNYCPDCGADMRGGKIGKK